jgi:FlaA1/EpsC-like NDP-sugar epimerase
MELATQQPAATSTAPMHVLDLTTTQPQNRGKAFRIAGLLLQDTFILALSFVLALSLRIYSSTPLIHDLSLYWRILVVAICFGIPFLFLSKAYLDLTRYATSLSLYRFALRATVMMAVLSQVSKLFGPQPPPSFWILYWTFFLVIGITSRVFVRDFLQARSKRTGAIEQATDAANPLSTANPTLIYGAGSFGSNLYQTLRNYSDLRIVGYLDDDTSLHGRRLQGLPIFNPEELPSITEKYQIQNILLAMPHIPRRRKREIVHNLTIRELKILSFPSNSQLASGKIHLSDLKPIEIEDLLGREPTSPMESLIGSCVHGLNVLVIGAGGSIGSDLCKRILDLGASKIVMLDSNEESLYTVDLEMRIAINKFPLELSKPIIVPVLGNCCETALLENITITEKIDTIYHAAAYKHVPLMERNICAGIANNMLATKSVVNAATKANVKWLSLISSDKAVRPTNVMGASKRLCELIVQAVAAEISSDGPKFSIVRFGNVLGTSGSVVPLFHRLIHSGGPVTVTDPSVTRYFMTRQEAVELVLQSTAISVGGDIFLLDMGDEVNITDMARQMIELSGLTVRDETNPEGDIEIVFTGLRPGEKLYEELFISGEPEASPHPLIMRVREPYMITQELYPLLDQLEDACHRIDLDRTLELLRTLVPEYNPDDKSV